MSKDLIKDKAALKRLIGKSINETMSALLPEGVPMAAPAAPPAPAPAPQQNNQMSVGKVATPTPGTDQQSDLQKGQITLEMVVEKLNSIRSGRSFKDENISAQMQQYFNDLNDNEKLALYAFSKGIAQIVTGDIQGNVAADPSQANPKVEMTDQGSMKNVRHVKPNIIKKVAAPAPAQAGVENTSAPTPIVAKQR